MDMTATQLQTLQISRSPQGRRLHKPLILHVPEPRSLGESAIQRFVVEAFSCKMPVLIEFTLCSPAVIELAKHLMRHNSGSPATLYQYTYGVWRYCRWIAKHPDEFLGECLGPEGEPVPKALSIHAKQLDEFVGELQAEGLAPGTISNHVKGVKALYRVNGLQLNLPYKVSRRVVMRDRAPTPEELKRIVELADLRGRVIVSMLALGGFRVGTLCRLRYRHVRRDLERGIVPLHIHVEAEITKGKYGEYDTFLAHEAVEYLRLYLEKRRIGSPEERTPPETINDESPLIRNSHSAQVTPITAMRIHTIVHNLYREAGLIKNRNGRRYELRAHSLRKYFRTQLAALGVNTDYIEYMMGHKISTYHDVQMKGLEFLRNIYAASGISIKPKTELSRVEMLKEIIRAWGMNPEEILAKEALTQPHRTYISPNNREQDHIGILTNTLKHIVRKELMDIKTP